MYPTAAAASPDSEAVTRDVRPRAPEARRRRTASNRRVSFQRRAPIVAVAEGVNAVGRGVVVMARLLGKLLLVSGLMGLLFFGGKLALAHVMDSPRFALREVTVSPTARVSYEEVLALAKVEAGDRLLALNTDAIAARVAEHPWVAEARVSRQLPAGLQIDIVERQATAVVLLGALYLLDDGGRPFKRATVAEADGLPVITGLERSTYVDHRQPAEAAFREALAIVAAWGKRADRPALGEVNLSPRYGFTVFLLDGGAEIRLGRGDYDRKLARLDQIFEAVEASGADGSAVRVVHLDGGNLSKISVGLELPETAGVPAAGS